MPSILQEKSMHFSIKIVELYKRLSEEHREYIMSKQLLRSGTSIGANIREARNGESALDFIHKLAISQKEADETLYWLEILSKTGYIDSPTFDLYS